MGTLTIRLPDEQHNRLKDLAAYKHQSLNKLFEEISTRMIVEFDTETRFKSLAAQGDVEEGLQLLDKLDSHFKTQP